MKHHQLQNKTFNYASNETENITITMSITSTNLDPDRSGSGHLNN